MDIFDAKGLKPMLIKDEVAAFDSPDFIYELKMDGIRCLAYVDTGGVDLRNKRNIALISLFPELREIDLAVRGRCILDGELVVLENGKPNFSRVESRVMTTNPSKIEIDAGRIPAAYVAYDILYRDGNEFDKLPLMERKDILRAAVDDTPRIAVSRVMDQGVKLFGLTTAEGLEGVVAKRRDSLYHYGKETKDWVKFKNLKDKDFIACGYIEKGHGVYSLVLGQIEDGRLCFKGHLTIGVTRDKVAPFKVADVSPFGESTPKGHEAAVWFASPLPVCTAVYMEDTSSGGMRQPRLKRIGMNFM